MIDSCKPWRGWDPRASPSQRDFKAHLCLTRPTLGQFFYLFIGPSQWSIIHPAAQKAGRGDNLQPSRKAAGFAHWQTEIKFPHRVRRGWIFIKTSWPASSSLHPARRATLPLQLQAGAAILCARSQNLVPGPKPSCRVPNPRAVLLLSSCCCLEHTLCARRSL